MPNLELFSVVLQLAPVIIFIAVGQLNSLLALIDCLAWSAKWRKNRIRTQINLDKLERSTQARWPIHILTQLNCAGLQPKTKSIGQAGGSNLLSAPSSLPCYWFSNKTSRTQKSIPSLVRASGGADQIINAHERGAKIQFELELQHLAVARFPCVPI